MNKKAILEGILFIVGDEGTTIDKIKDILNGKLKPLKEEGYREAKKKDVKLVGIELVELYKKVLDK